VAISKASLNTVLHQDVNEPVEVADAVIDTPMRMALSDCQALALQNRPLLKQMPTPLNSRARR